MDDQVTLRRSVTSYGASDDSMNTRPSSLIVDSQARRRRPITSQWYLAYYIPALEWMRKYSWSAFPGDFCSGITLASFQIPVSLSYATSLANLDAICGLHGLIVAPLVYAFLGSVPVMVVSPEGPISLIIGKLAPPYLSNPPDHHHGRSTMDPQEVSALIAGSAGAFILFMGLIRVGFLTSMLAQSLLRGFITGVGVVMIADQIPAMLGLSAAMHKQIGLDASSFAKAKYVWHHWQHAKPVETQFSLYALVALFVFKFAKRYLINKKGYRRAVLIPDILLVVAVSTLVSKWGQFHDRNGLSVVGDVNPDGLEVMWMLRPKYLNDFKINFQSSFYVAILGLLESTVAARLLGSGSVAETAGEDETGMRSTNRELVALGTANVVGSMFGALPSFGGYGRSKINILSGGTTQMSGIVSACMTLICTYKLMGLVYYLPRCTLSAIISSIGFSLLEEAPREVSFFWKLRSYGDLATMMLSLLTTFFWSVEAGVTVGAGTALVRILHHATKPRIQLLIRDPSTSHFVNADILHGGRPLGLDDGILVVKVPEPLTFANSTILEDRLKRLELHGTTKVHPGQPRSRKEQLNIVIFHLKGMTECDASAAFTLKGIITNYLNRGIRVIFTEIIPSSELNQVLHSSGIIEMLERQPWDSAFYPTVHDAIGSLS